MRVLDLNNIQLPNKYDEEFRKIDFKEFFSYEFEDEKQYVLDIVGLDESFDNKTYDNFLFDLTYFKDKKQVVLDIKEDTNKPIFLLHRLTNDKTFYTNALKIEVQQGIKAQVIEVFESDCSNSAYSINRGFDCKEDSSLEYMKIQNIKKSNSFLYSADFKQDSNAQINFLNFDYGDGFVVNNFVNHIEKQNCIYNLFGLVKSNNNANISNLVKTIHNASSSLSNIEFKHALDDNAKAVFKAKSRVEKVAVNSKAFQNSNTILLSDDASVFAQPHLEIFIDELEASHGATTGTLDEEQLLYLQMRGIEKEKAQLLLLEAFENQVYDKIQDKQMKEFLREYIGS